MHERIIAIGLAMLAGTGAAQQSSKDALAALGIKIVEPMSAEQQAKTRAKVDAELMKTGVVQWFDNVSDAYGGKARHRPSGLTCPLGGKGQRVLAASAEGAVCRTRNGDMTYETTVARAAPGADLSSIAAQALGAAEQEAGYAPFRGSRSRAVPARTPMRPTTGRCASRAGRKAASASAACRSASCTVGS